MRLKTLLLILIPNGIFALWNGELAGLHGRSYPALFKIQLLQQNKI